jgi:hypothetical protein
MREACVLGKGFVTGCDTSMVLSPAATLTHLIIKLVLQSRYTGTSDMP